MQTHRLENEFISHLIQHRENPMCNLHVFVEVNPWWFSQLFEPLDEEETLILASWDISIFPSVSASLSIYPRQRPDHQNHPRSQFPLLRWMWMEMWKARNEAAGLEKREVVGRGNGVLGWLDLRKVKLWQCQNGVTPGVCHEEEYEVHQAALEITDYYLEPMAYIILWRSRWQLISFMIQLFIQVKVTSSHSIQVILFSLSADYSNSSIQVKFIIRNPPNINVTAKELHQIASYGNFRAELQYSDSGTCSTRVSGHPSLPSAAATHCTSQISYLTQILNPLNHVSIILCFIICLLCSVSLCYQFIWRCPSFHARWLR